MAQTPKRLISGSVIIGTVGGYVAGGPVGASIRVIELESK